MFTYLLGWSNLDRWYYGVSFASSRTEEDLWVKYKTSSKHVKQFAELHGDPDVIMVRRRFSSSDKARAWETKVLKRIGVVHSEKWINKTDNKAISSDAAERGRKNRDRAKIGENTRTWYASLSNSEKQKVRDAKRAGMINKTEEARKRQSEGIRKYQQEAWADPLIKAKRSESMRKPRAKVTCPYCGKVGGGGAMRQYHMDNCKSK